MSTRKRKLFTCDDCPFVTEYKNLLLKHQMRHREGEFHCDHCNFPFRAKGHLTAHLRERHGKLDFDPRKIRRCDMCPYSTLHSGDFQLHLRKHAATGFNCRYCNYPFLNEKIMICHVRKCKYNPDKETELVKERPCLETRRNQRQEIYSSFEKSTDGDKRSKTRTNPRRLKRKLVKMKGRDNPVSASKHAKQEVRGASYNSDNRRNRSVRDQDNLTVTITQNDQGSENDKVTYTEYVSGTRNRQKSVTYSTDQDEIDNDHLLSDDPSDISLMSVEDVTVSASVEDALLETSDLAVEFESITIFLPDNVTTKAVKCMNCNFITTNTNAIAEHIATHKNGKYKCMACNLPFIHSDDLDKHMKTVHEKNTENKASTEQNNYINKVTNTSTQSGNAKRTEHNCIFCDFKTYNFLELKEHIDGHTSSDSANSSRDDVDAFDINDDVTVGEEVYVVSSDDSDLAESRFGTSADSELVDVDCVKDQEGDEGESYIATKVELGSIPEEDEQTEETENMDDKLVKIDDTADLYEHSDTTIDNIIEEKENLCTTVSVEKNSIEPSVSNILGCDNTKIKIDKKSKGKFLSKLKKLYAEVSDESGLKYRCLVCDSDRLFKTRKCIRKHFRKHHKKLQRKVCESCPHCSKPFP